jgi:hypothetical protein
MNPFTKTPIDIRLDKTRQDMTRNGHAGLQLDYLLAQDQLRLSQAKSVCWRHSRSLHYNMVCNVM